ncbi:KIF23 (predicted) [Pycnogonum litorale]
MEKRIQQKQVNKMQEQLVAERERMKRIMEKRIQQKQVELKTKMCLNEEKFRQLKDILNFDDWGLMLDPFSQTSSDTKLDAVFDSEKRSRSPTSATPSTRIAVSNPRHRRSRSSNADVWLDHRPVGTLELDTVLRPKMKKKKSVSKLNVQDVTKDTSKYLLTNQENTSNGELKTEYYKGDVIPTSGGGAQVVFQDVEVLKQVSLPYQFRKRNSSSSKNVKPSEVKNRCMMGIVDHQESPGSNFKRAS